MSGEPPNTWPGHTGSGVSRGGGGRNSSGMNAEPESALASKMISGSFWMVGLRLARRSVGLISAIVLARILAPADYGLVAVGLLCISLFEVLTEFGVRANLVRERRHDVALLSTAWTLEVLRGLVISIVVFAAAPVAAAFFNQPGAVPIVRAMSLIPLLRSVANIKIVYFQREMEFHKQFAYQLCGIVGGLGTAVAAAIILRNAWALVLGQLAASLISSVLSYVFFPEFPRICFNGRALAGLYSFGKWVFVGSILSYFALEGDKYFTGRLFGVAVLGAYKLASMTTNIIVQEFGKSVTQVFFPAYSKISGDTRALRKVFIQAYGSLLSIIAPLCLGLSVAAADFVGVVLGNKWLEIVPLLQLLAIAGFARTLFISGGGLSYALNKPNYNAICEAGRAMILLACLLFFPARIGVLGVAVSVLIANVTAFVAYLRCWSKLLDVGPGYFLKTYASVLCSLLAMLAVLFPVKMCLEGGLLRLIVSVSAGMAAYIASQVALYRFFNIGALRSFLYAFRS